MRRYHSSTLGGLAHLGPPSYDKEDGVWVEPTKTLCGLEPTTWSKGFVRITAWTKRRMGTGCMECDRTAMWESTG